MFANLSKTPRHCTLRFWSSIMCLMHSTDESMLVKTMCANLSKRPLHIAPTDQASSAWCSVLSPCWWKPIKHRKNNVRHLSKMPHHCTLRLLNIKCLNAQYWWGCASNVFVWITCCWEIWFNLLLWLQIADIKPATFELRYYHHERDLETPVMKCNM